MSEPSFDALLDVKGLNCPMPLVRARKSVGGLEAGQVLKVLSTDRGSVKDFQGWARVARDVELLAQETVDEDDREVYVHYVRRT